MSVGITSRLDRRREVLMERLDAILETEARGDGGTTWIELELLATRCATFASCTTCFCSMRSGRTLDSVAKRTKRC